MVALRKHYTCHEAMPRGAVCPRNQKARHVWLAFRNKQSGGDLLSRNPGVPGRYHRPRLVFETGAGYAFGFSEDFRKIRLGGVPQKSFGGITVITTCCRHFRMLSLPGLLLFAVFPQFVKGA